MNPCSCTFNRSKESCSRNNVNLYVTLMQSRFPTTKVLYNAVGVKQVDVPSFSGSFGILPAHVPSLAVLKPGVVTVIENQGEPKKFFVSSGTITINEDSTGNLISGLSFMHVHS